MTEVEKTAKLAQLLLSEEEVLQYSSFFKEALEFASKVSEIDTQGVKPLVTPFQEPIYLREDEPKIWEKRKQALEEAPELEGSLFKVPPVL